MKKACPRDFPGQAFDSEDEDSDPQYPLRLIFFCSLRAA